MRSISRTLTMAWVEYQESGDGAAFTHVCTSRLGFKNAFALLPRAKGSSTTRVAANAGSSKFVVRAFRDPGKKPLRGLIAIPGKGDEALFERWVTSPAISGDELSAAPGAPEPIDLLVLSGHGGGGDVWGDASGEDTQVSPAFAFLQYEQQTRSGRLKCIISPACSNVNIHAAGFWLSAFRHPQPVHLILGYEGGYSGGAIGARALAKFAETIAKNRSMPLIEAWKVANESVRARQPWAALAAMGGEGLTIEDWLKNDLPPLSNIEDLLHFNEDHPQGQDVELVDKDYQVSWVTGGPAETVVQMGNNNPARTDVGLVAGKPGKIRIRSKRASMNLKKGQEVYLFIYQYRPDREFDINDLLTFDADLLGPHPSTGVPVVNPEKGRVLRDGPPSTDALRIVVPFDTDLLELGFEVNASATDVLKPDGPGQTHGRYLLDFVHLHATMFFQGRHLVVQQFGGRTFPATDGALLRR